ncbi:MAG: hypothetical protein ACT6RA_15150, partial [Flavobacterium sp.]
IALFKDNITITNFDAEIYIENYIPNLPVNTLIYLDPPYYDKGSLLYLNAYKKGDHARLSDTIQSKVNHKWVLSYDGVTDIIDLYKQRRHFLYDLQYSAAKVYKGKEIFIFCDSLTIPIVSSLLNINAGIESLIETQN